MRKSFEIIAGMIILVFMAIVMWQVTHMNSASKTSPITSTKQITENKNVSIVSKESMDKIPETGSSSDNEVLTPEGSLPVSPDVPEQPIACTMDAKQCPDGSYVGRVGPDCEFAACSGTKPEPETEVIRYGEDMTYIEKYRQDCTEKGGVFNECTSACGPEAEICADVCSMICEVPVTTESGPVTIVCSPWNRDGSIECADIYSPVCGQVEVQCITTPCEPVSQTFGNACGACAQGNVISYTEGECESDQ